MDERLARLDGLVAAAADAWLTDPLDAGVYSRLVRAVRERRAHLDLVPGDGTAEGEPIALPDGAAPAPEVLDLLDVLADRRPVQSLGASLAGADPRAVLDRLRRGQA